MPSPTAATGKQGRPAVAARTVGPSRAGPEIQATGGWTEPRKTKPAVIAPPVSPTPVSNRFGMLREEDSPEQDHTGEEQNPNSGTPPPKRKRRRARKKEKETKEEQPEEGNPEVKLLERPHKSTWFLPGKVGRVPVQILVDTR